MSLISSSCGVGLGAIVWAVSGWTAGNPVAVLMTSLVAGGIAMLLVGCWRLLCYLAHMLLGRRLERTCQQACW